MATAPVPIEQLKQNMRNTWMAGDFGVIAKRIAKGAEEFIATLPIHSGARALDVACGTGNSAVPLARRGAIVTGVDIATNLLAQARQRAAAENLAIQFDEGDAEALPYGNASFDVIVTMYGAMFAPRPEMVAAEFGRVAKPGAMLAMANWNPESFAGQIFKLGARYAPPPPGVPPPVLWGDADTARQRLEPCFTDIRTELQPVLFDYPNSPEEVVGMFREYFGPTKMAFARLDAEGQAAFARDMVALWKEANVSTEPGRTIVHTTHLRVMATRR